MPLAGRGWPPSPSTKLVSWWFMFLNVSGEGARICPSACVNGRRAAAVICGIHDEKDPDTKTPRVS